MSTPAESTFARIPLDELLALLVKRVVALLDSERCTVFLYDAERRELFSRVASGAEVKEIMRHLRESEGGREFDLIQEWATRPTELQAILLRHKPNLVHFSGHGDASGKLIFEDSQGSACTVPVDAIGRLFSILGDGIQCVVLNACQSIAQARALSTHVPCVIGMNAAISDPAAMAFSSSFYLALGHGHSVQRGFELGCLQIDLAGATAVDVPILLCKDGIDPNSLIFAAKTR